MKAIGQGLAYNTQEWNNVVKYLISRPLHIEMGIWDLNGHGA